VYVTTQIEPTDPTSKRFAAWSVATARTPISTPLLTLRDGLEMLHYKHARTEQP
jgi:hypothetical protein